MSRESGNSPAPVIAGLAVGLAFIVLMSQASFQTSIERYTLGLIDSINPSFGIENHNRKLAVDIMLQNSTVIELLKDRNVHISAIAVMPNGCSSGGCARIELWKQDDYGVFMPEQAQALIDYSNRKVIRFQYTDGW